MKALIPFSFILGLLVSLDVSASPDMTHDLGVGSKEALQLEDMAGGDTE